jgi:hypothetical protein
MSQNELFHDACEIIEQAQRWAYQAVNETLIKRNWLLGMRIQHEVLNDQRAEYGEQVVKTLSEELRREIEQQKEITGYRILESERASAPQRRSRMERSAGSQRTLRSWSLGSHWAASCSFRVGLGPASVQR